MDSESLQWLLKYSKQMKSKNSLLTLSLENNAVKAISPPIVRIMNYAYLSLFYQTIPINWSNSSFYL